MASSRDERGPGAPKALRRRHPGVALRIAWTISSCFVVECVVFGLAVWPAIVLWDAAARATSGTGAVRPVMLGAALVPIYVVFSCSLMVWSALATRLLGWRVRPGTETRIADYDWPMLKWVRQMVLAHVVRVCVGLLFRSSPLWTLYMRMNGARLGKGVYVNSLVVSDHHLLEFGNHVVIGGDAHISGHTVESGILKTARVRLGDRVVIGTGSIIGIGVEIGSDCQIGALTFVPKYSKLQPHTSYLSVPLHMLQHQRKVGS